MQLNVLDTSLNDKVKRLQSELGVTLDPTGETLKCTIDPTLSQSSIQRINNTIELSATDLPTTWYLLKRLANEPGTRSLTVQKNFRQVGMMLDCSRNSVPRVSYLKSLIRQFATMGHTWLMLYMEDVYEVPEQPYFGAYRGRYSHDELRELDAYAEDLGIELVPCIQTLAHLNQFMEWEHITRQYGDIDDILNVGRPETLTLIEQMIQSLRQCFKTDKIHIGMDEAYNLGRGTYLDEQGLKPKVEILHSHLENVLQICHKYQFNPIMWDDMFFSKYSKVESENYQIPSGVQLMYWDYYRTDYDEYDQRFKERQAITDDLAFAGGAWRWTGVIPHHSKTLYTTLPALEAAKKYGVKDLLATCWGDEGSETPQDAIRFGAVLYTYLQYHAHYDEEEFDAHLRLYTELSLSDWLKQEQADLLPEFSIPASLNANPSKYLLFQDLLMPLFIQYTEELDQLIDYTKHLTELEQYFATLEAGDSQVNHYYQALVGALKLRWRLPLTLREAYGVKDHQTLSTIANETIPLLNRALDELLDARRDLWLTEAKPQGLEVIEFRIGMLKTRGEGVALRINDYLAGKIDSIEELHEQSYEPLPDQATKGVQTAIYVRQNTMMSRNKISW